jgi:homoserine dehydrogenase
VHVVSASKAHIAEHGAALTALAMRNGAQVRYSAAVGGVTPMIETVDRAAAQNAILRIAGVLNGTCNLVLDACATGASLLDAVREAQREGFAEANAREDLSGRDAARKLRILCRHAFRLEPETSEVEVLDDSIAQRPRDAVARGHRLRQIARATREGDRIHAQVTFEVVEEGSFFGRLSCEWNALEIVDTAGKVYRAAGRGAGRWPTTEAVMADLFDLHRSRITPSIRPYTLEHPVG